MKQINIVLVLVFSCLSLVNCVPAYLSHLFKEEVNYDLELIENCACNSLWKWNEDVKLHDGTKLLLNGNGTMDRDFDDSVIIGVEIQKFSEKNWKPFFKLVKENACTACKTVLEDDFVLITKILGLESSSCPIPKDTYVINDYEVDLRDTIANRFLIGRYKTTIEIFTAAKEKLLCVEFTVTTTKRDD